MSEVPANVRPTLPTQSVTPEGSLLPAGRPLALASSPSSQPPKKRRPRKPKAPKESKIYKAVVAYIALKAQGLKTDEIAEQLGIGKNTIKQYVYYANQRGWLNMDTLVDPEDQVDVVLKSKSVRNINVLLDERVRNEETGETFLTERAGKMSLEIAKGTGLLKTHTATKVEGQASLGVALRVQVEMPVARPNNPEPLLTVRPGTTGGQPYFDAEVVEDE